MIRESRSLPVVSFLLFFITFHLNACSPFATKVSPSPTQKAPDLSTAEVVDTEMPSTPENSRSYAVVRIPKDEMLVIRQPAGQSGTEVGTFEWNAKNLRVTGNRTLLGSSLWVEVEFGVEGLGWVNSLNITESITSDDFCNDQRVIELLNSLRTAVENADETMLSQLLHETRGLAIRVNWYSPEVRFTLDEVVGLYSLPNEIEWGTMADSGLTVTGTFVESIVPKLEDVFLRSPEATCNALKYGSTDGKILWPEELTNIKFYGIYRSPETDGNEFDWRSWAVGIEYNNGNPYIAVLIHYSSEL